MISLKGDYTAYNETTAQRVQSGKDKSMRLFYGFIHPWLAIRVPHLGQKLLAMKVGSPRFLF